MNETLKIIKKRRSVRKYKAEQIKDSELREIMEAAINAPSAMNQQKWHFSVVQNKDLLGRMVDIMRENILDSGVEFLAARAKEPGFSPFHGAPLVVFVTADAKAKFSVIDASLAAQNILLAAESLGIGSCIMTSSEFLFASEKGRALQKEIGIPDGYDHVCAVTLGYKAEDPPAKPRNRDAVTYVK